MLSFALQKLALWHHGAYLKTETRCLPAIRLYLDFGFLPDFRSDSVAVWEQVAANLEHPALATAIAQAVTEGGVGGRREGDSVEPPIGVDGA